MAEGTGSRALRANSLLRPETTCKSLPSRGGRGRGGGGSQLERRRGRGHDPLARAGAGSGRPSPAEGPRSRAPTTNGRAGGRHGVGHAAACARLRPAPTRALLLCGGGDDSARGLRRSRRPHPGRTQWSAAVLATPPSRGPSLTTRSLVCSGSVMTTAAPPALVAAGRAARLPPPGAPSSSRPSSSPLLPPPLLLLQRSGRSRFLPAGPPRFLGPARAVPLPELGSSQAAAAAFFLGMVALEETRGSGAQWTGYKLRGGRGAQQSHRPPLPPLPSPKWRPRGGRRGGEPGGNRAPPGAQRAFPGESRKGVQAPDCNPLRERKKNGDPGPSSS